MSNKGQKLIVINGVEDHIHLLLGLKPDCKLSDLVRDIKANSTQWVKANGYVRGKFEWQVGFGAFSVSRSDLSSVVAYIERQEEHHRKKTFREEYLNFLKEHEIEFKVEYLPDDVV